MNSSAMRSPMTSTVRWRKASMSSSSRSWRPSRLVASRKNPPGGFDQIVDDGVRLDVGRLARFFKSAVTGSHEYSFRADGGGQLHVDPAVADRVRPRWIHGQLEHRAIDKATT